MLISSVSPSSCTSALCDFAIVSFSQFLVHIFLKPSSVGSMKVGATLSSTVWVGKLEANTSYQLWRMTICTYNGYKYVNFPKEGGSFTIIDDISDVVATNDNHLNVSDNIQDAEICGVSGLF